MATTAATSAGPRVPWRVRAKSARPLRSSSPERASSASSACESPSMPAARTATEAAPSRPRTQPSRSRGRPGSSQAAAIARLRRIDSMAAEERQREHGICELARRRRQRAGQRDRAGEEQDRGRDALGHGAERRERRARGTIGPARAPVLLTSASCRTPSRLRCSSRCPQLLDPNFRRSVILLIHHDAGGHLRRRAELGTHRDPRRAALRIHRGELAGRSGGRDPLGGPVQPQTGFARGPRGRRGR
jgi:hypothetical protein